MSSKVYCWLVLCLTILLAAFLVQSSEGATFRTFRTRHIDNPKTRAANDNAYCNRMMQRRGMTRRQSWVLIFQLRKDGRLSRAEPAT